MLSSLQNTLQKISPTNSLQ